MVRGPAQPPNLPPSSHCRGPEAPTCENQALLHRAGVRGHWCGLSCLWGAQRAARAQAGRAARPALGGQVPPQDPNPPSPVPSCPAPHPASSAASPSRAPAASHPLSAGLCRRRCSSGPARPGGRGRRLVRGQSPRRTRSADLHQEPSPPSALPRPRGLRAPLPRTPRCPRGTGRGWGPARPPPPQHRCSGGAQGPWCCWGARSSGRDGGGETTAPGGSGSRLPRSGSARREERAQAPTGSASRWLCGSCPNFSRFFRSFCFWEPERAVSRRPAQQHRAAAAAAPGRSAAQAPGRLLPGDAAGLRERSCGRAAGGQGHSCGTQSPSSSVSSSPPSSSPAPPPPPAPARSCPLPGGATP